LSENQRIGLALYDDLNTRIPRAECKAIYDVVRAEAIAIDAKVWIDIMGSYRRGSSDSGDVDFLITRDPADGQTHCGILRKLVNTLSSKGFITHEVSRRLIFADGS
jgi:DNA polymerase lambda